jgi:hypothetical protein
MTCLTSSRPSYREAEFQDQLDLVRWEGEGGAPAPQIPQCVAVPSSRLVEVKTGSSRRVRELVASA